MLSERETWKENTVFGDLVCLMIECRQCSQISSQLFSEAHICFGKENLTIKYEI